MEKRAISLLLCVLLCLSLCPSALAAPDGIRIGIIDSGVSLLSIRESDVAEGINYPKPGERITDMTGHGTEIASIIVGSEAAGVTGVFPDATLVPLRWSERTVYEDAAGTERYIADISRAIRDAVDLCGCRILNISSSTSVEDERLRSAAEYAESRGVLVVASAGNSAERKPYALAYPAAYETVVSVGATDSEGRRASFSQQNDTVDLLAWGVDVPAADQFGAATTVSGTSFSAPIVCAAAAKIWTKYPSLTVSELRAALQCCTRSVDGLPVLDLALVDAFAPGDAMYAEEAAQKARAEEKRRLAAPVLESDYYYDAVVWAVGRGVTEGRSLKEFRPNKVTTRAQMLRFIWRAQGSPAPKAAYSMFIDVLPGDACEKAVIWAVENGIVTGVDRYHFAPDDEVTRAQAVALLARMSGVSDDAAGYSHGFTDVKPTDYCSNAVAWAAANGITTGTSETTFSPNDKCLHSQIITFLYRAMEK